jgi:hypothetical protein
MHFDASALSKHKYTIAGVIVGAFVLFKLINGKSSASANPTTAAGNSSLAQIQAAQAVQTGAQNAAVQTAQIQADAQKYATDASVKMSDNALAATLAQYAAQLDLGKYQTDAAVTEAGMQTRVALATVDASNHQADLAERVSQSTIAAQKDITETYLSDAYSLARTDQANNETNTQYILQHAGDKKNSQLDATDQTTLFQTILAKGSPGVAATGSQASVATATEEKSGTVQQNGAIIGAATGIAKTILDGLF